AIVLLAAFGLYDFATSVRAKRLLMTAAIAMLIVVSWGVVYAHSLNIALKLTPKAHTIFVGLQFLPFIALALFLLLGSFSKARVVPLLIALVVVGESVLLFFVPTAESPKQITVDYAPIHYLQANQGQYRFLDFAVLYPNWGTEYGVKSLSAIDLPFPKAFKNFIEDQLYPGLKPGNQFV